MRRHQKLPLCWAEPAPEGSRMDLPLAKAKPTSDAERASVIRY